MPFTTTIGPIVMRVILLVTVLLVASPLAVALGQGTPAPAHEFVSYQVLTVNPDMVNEFESLIINDTNPALIKGGLKWRQVWKTATFGESYTYIIISPIPAFAQFDSTPPLEKALGKDGLARYRAKQLKLIRSSHTRAVEMRPDLSYVGKMDGAYKLAIASTVRVAPGKNKEVEDFVATTILPAMKQTGTAGYFVSQTMLGGDVNEYTTVFLMDSYADLDKGTPLVRALGKEGAAKVTDKLSPGAILSVEREFLRYAPELSFTTQDAAPK